MYNNGVLIVFAAGNTSTCGNTKDNPIYPNNLTYGLFYF